MADYFSRLVARCAKQRELKNRYSILIEFMDEHNIKDYNIEDDGMVIIRNVDIQLPADDIMSGPLPFKVLNEVK